MAFDPALFAHESDRKALAALQKLPGFSRLTKAFMEKCGEQQQKILNMSTRIRLGKDQMPQYYNMLPPICAKLGIDVPELYIELNVTPNAYTYGDTNPFIVFTSGLVETIPEELIPTVLAHECGHIACEHALYQTMGRVVISGASALLDGLLGVGGLVSVPLQLAFYRWMRCSEFSADRAAVLCDGTPRKMQEVCMRLAGWDKDIEDANLHAFMQQAEDYQDMIDDSKWNKALEFMVLSGSTHPLMAVRATQCGVWAQSEEYKNLISGI